MAVSALKHHRKIVFVSDTTRLVQLYRGDLISTLRARGVEVRSVGFRGSLLAFLRAIFSRSTITVSSNLKTNLLVLALSRGRGVVILNGLGRYRKAKIFRSFLLLLLRHNRQEKIIVVQNYGDMRWLRRYGIESQWICGSGGREKKIGVSPSYTVVTRQNKLRKLLPSLHNFLDEYELNAPTILLVGCESVDKEAVRDSRDALQLVPVGWVEQDDILYGGQRFLQLTGYGEGFPHSLADALVSSATVIITKADFVRFGLHRLGYRFSRETPSWGKVKCDANASDKIKVTAVNEKYIKALELCSGWQIGGVNE